VLALTLLVGCGSSNGGALHPERAGNQGNGNAAAGAQVDWGEPSNGDPRGLIMLLHGGGWLPNPAAYEQLRQYAPTLQASGYATVAIGYDKGARGFRQIRAIYRNAAEKRYPGLPVCVLGTSAGGHLGLMLAAREPDLACVVDLVGPTNLTSLDDQGSATGYQYAAQAFGENKLGKYSPVRYAKRIKARIMIVLAQNDPLIPVEQGAELKRRLPRVELIVLPEGPTPWLHDSTVDAASIENANARQSAFLARATSGG
jgi:dipeptidyl aminopeptidase/acylaminoacyl peptidase